VPMSECIALSDLNAVIAKFDDTSIRLLSFRFDGQDIQVPYSDRPAHRNADNEVLIHQRVDGPETVEGISLIPDLSVDEHGSSGKVFDGHWLPQ